MRRFAYLALMVVVIVAALWLYSSRSMIRVQWDCYEVTSSPSYEAFRQRMERFQKNAHDEERLRALVHRWQTGNEPFDEHLARYLFDPQCGEALRETFSRELSWREDLPAAWGEHWRRQKPDVEDETASLRRYLEALHAARPPRRITWRDVLELQAVLALAGQGSLAHRLTPDNWRGRYEQWCSRAARAAVLP